MRIGKKCITLLFLFSITPTSSYAALFNFNGHCDEIVYFAACGDIGLSHGDPVGGFIDVIDSYVAPSNIILPEAINTFGFIFGNVAFSTGYDDSLIGSMTFDNTASTFIAGLFFFDIGSGSPNPSAVASDVSWRFWHTGSSFDSAEGPGSWSRVVAVDEPGSLHMLILFVLITLLMIRRRYI